MRAEDIEKLKCLNVFRGVKENTFQRAIAPSFLQSFPAGTILLEENRPADFLYIVLDGLGPVDKVDSQISGSMIQDCLLGGGFGSRRPDGYG
ncbi:hypothetical protein, partial [Sphingomonas psychrolutea]|uniref:hypothetical protein n=1 Tax=Sphingomonas psychrolutea TaxID=1259676 RepID=UPI0025481613